MTCYWTRIRDFSFQPCKNTNARCGLRLLHRIVDFIKNGCNGVILPPLTSTYPIPAPPLWHTEVAGNWQTDGY